MSTAGVDPFWVARGARLLSNGRYQVLLDARGGGVSFWQGVQLSAWEPDPVEARHGWWLYLRDTASGEFWMPTLVGRPGSAAAPSLQMPSPGSQNESSGDDAGASARSERVDGEPATSTPSPLWAPLAGRSNRGSGVQTYQSIWRGIEAEVAIWVDAEWDVEVRETRLRNLEGRSRRIEVTSHIDIVLNHPAAHRAHPAFSKLFVESRWLGRRRALLWRRRPRSPEEKWPLLAHAALADYPVEWESDRAGFVGRGCDSTTPHALMRQAPLQGRVGPVLDPTAALRQTVELAPRALARVAFVLAVGESQEALEAVLERLSGTGGIDRSRSGAQRLARQRRQRIQVGPAAALRAEELAAALRYGCGSGARTGARISKAGPRVPEVAPPTCVPLLVWKTGRPLREAMAEAKRFVRFWESCGFPASIAVEARQAMHWVFSDGVTVRRKTLGKFDGRRRDLWETMAGCVVEGDRLSLGRAPARVSVVARYKLQALQEPIEADASRLSNWNGWGGFDLHTGAYVIQVTGGRLPPMPWVNVMANPAMGCLVSERGAMHTWGVNSREDRITPWSNDPVVDPFAEAIYIREEQEHAFWSPLPGLGAEPCVVRHAPGWSSWQSAGNGVEQSVTVFVPPHDPLRVTIVTLNNRAGTERKLDVWWYVHLVCGALPEETRRFVEVDWDPKHQLFLVRRIDHESRHRGVVFAAVAGGEKVQVSGCRLHFLGPGGSLRRPRAVVEDEELRPVMGRTGHPAVVARVAVRLPARGSAQVSLILGEAAQPREARMLAQKFRGRHRAVRALEETRFYWRQSVCRLQVRTPSPELDRLVNQWLPYQVQSCRLWGRTAFYQSGGAYGFRDQLQDASALLWLDPSATRQQILLHAAHQFPEGDVLHWWHPPWDRGTRTRFSDDLLWLPWAVVSYCEFTGDGELLDEPCPFVTGRRLRRGEDEAYLTVRRTRHTADLYTHCRLAIDRALTRGPHGLPLMGTGDWNDGMNRVGRLGRGESVWLAFFLGALLRHWIPICESRGDHRRAAHYRSYLDQLESAVEEYGWDGNWYRRAYYDDGTPLGSASNQECQIDALVQAWAVLSGMAPRSRAASALEAVSRRLIDRERGLIRLLDPPFDRNDHDPGYIKGYVPGVRENGGQYTHAAIWVVQAFALLGQRNTATELLLRLLPQWHSRDAEAVSRYQVEPYVVASDIYGSEPHVGRGGWTWYTGSAGWLYRLVVETFLGVRLHGGDTLVVEPRIPDFWRECEMTWHPPGWSAPICIRIENPEGRAERVRRAWADGTPLPVDRREVRLDRRRAVPPSLLRVELGTGEEFDLGGSETGCSVRSV